LFDIKILDPDRHKQFTGYSNDLILRNLATVADTIRTVNRERTKMDTPGMKLWIRTPLIPDATASPDNIAAISQYIHENLSDVVERWELCAFNNACNAKYKKLDQTWTYADYPLMNQDFVDSLQQVALSTGSSPEYLVISGLIAKGSG
jgi:pyruvate formate lyase activating enzyme